MRKNVKNEKNVKSVNETKVVCPKCGTEFAIADKTHVTVGIVIGKDAGLGTIHPKVADEKKVLPSKADERIAALKAVGVDVSGFFSIKGADDGEYVGRMVDGKMTILSDDDPVYSYILEEGDVYNSKLARRWVMSQTFHMLAREMQKDRWGNPLKSITQQIRDKGYDYMWKQMEDELYAQMMMYKNGDDENYRDRRHWFGSRVLYWMINDYRAQLDFHIRHGVKVQKCKGVPYKNICGENVFITDIKKKVFAPIEPFLESVKGYNSPSKLYQIVREFNKIRKTRGWNPKQCQGWIDAYKGAGAFFTMQNMIRFHKCRFLKENGAFMNKSESYDYLLSKNSEYEGEGWRMVGLLRQFLKDNDIDINKKMAEWRKK